MFLSFKLQEKYLLSTSILVNTHVLELLQIIRFAIAKCRYSQNHWNRASLACLVILKCIQGRILLGIYQSLRIATRGI